MNERCDICGHFDTRWNAPAHTVEECRDVLRRRLDALKILVAEPIVGLTVRVSSTCSPAQEVTVEMPDLKQPSPVRLTNRVTFSPLHGLRIDTTRPVQLALLGGQP